MSSLTGVDERTLDGPDPYSRVHCRFIFFSTSAHGTVTLVNQGDAPMAVGGLILSLSPDLALRQSAEDCVRSDPRLEEGPRHRLRMAVVATTDTLGEGHDLCEALLAHPGIENLEVAYVAPEEERAAIVLTEGDE
ncbi:MAG: hypothetical protein ABGY15_00185 [bacterium]